MKNIKFGNFTVGRGRFAMAMDKINGFAAMSRGLLDRFQGAGRADDPVSETEAKDRDVGQGPKSAPADVAEISPKAHRLIALRHAMDSGLKALEDVPEVRPDRVAEARARLNRGYYNSVEVRARVAERLDDVARHLEDI